MLRRPVLVVVLVATITALFLLAAGCSNSSTASTEVNDQLAALEQQLADLQAKVEALEAANSALQEALYRASVTAAVDVIDSAGFHHMSEAIEAGKLEEQFISKVDRALAAAKAAYWPEGLASVAAEMVADMEQLYAALVSQDLTLAQDAVERLHSSQHHLSEQARVYLKEGATSGDGHQDAHDDDHDAQEVSLVIEDWKFSGDITVKKGKVRLVVTNQGKMPHGFWLPEFGINVMVPAGTTQEIVFEADKVGEFEFRCSNQGCGTKEQHEGMVGKLIVTE